MAMGYGDPDELDRLAQRLVGRADEVRERAADQVRQAYAAHWVSAEAQRYRDRVAQDRAEADRAAGELERAATALRAHAQEVRETLAHIARLERDTVDWFEHQLRGVAGRVEHAMDAAGRLVSRLVHDVPWSDWRYTPENLPASGDRQWLEVGRFLQSKGVL